MSNLYAVTDSYQLIYNPAVSGDFSGYMQSVGGNTITCKIADSLPSDDVGSFEIESGDSIETILNGYYIRVDGLVDSILNTGLQLYAKTASGEGTLSLIAPIAISLGSELISDSNPIPTKSAANPASESSTITTGGTAQVLMEANSKRQGIEFYNNSSGSLWLNVVGTATAGGGSIEVRSGGYWSPSVCPVTAISVIGATTAQAFTCWEYAPIDPSLTLALLHFDGADGSNTFTDSAPVPHTYTTGAPSTTKLATAFSRFGVSSLASSSDGIEWSGSLATLGNSDWTAEGWFYQSESSAQHRGLFMLYSDSSSLPVTVYLKNRLLYAGIHFAAESFALFNHQTTTPLTEFTHWALVRYKGVITLYLNGIASTSTITANTKLLRPHGLVNISIALDVVGNIGYGLNGYQDEFRFRNEAVYSGNFTPPTAPFTY